MNAAPILDGTASDFGAHVSLTERIVLACLCALAVIVTPLLEERHG